MLNDVMLCVFLSFFIYLSPELTLIHNYFFIF